VVNQHFDKISLSNGKGQYMWGGSFLKFSFQTFFGWIIQTQT
jgi:hypothetical protein